MLVRWDVDVQVEVEVEDVTGLGWTGRLNG